MKGRLATLQSDTLAQAREFLNPTTLGLDTIKDALPKITDAWNRLGHGFVPEEARQAIEAQLKGLNTTVDSAMKQLTAERDDGARQRREGVGHVRRPRPRRRSTTRSSGSSSGRSTACPTCSRTSGRPTRSRRRPPTWPPPPPATPRRPG
jgi:hypothetical protein